MGELNLKLSELQAKHRIKKQLQSGPEKDLVAEAIYHLLEDNGCLDKLMLATMGIKPETKFHKGQEVYVRVSDISNDWNFDKPEMERLGMIKQDRILCQILEVNPWKTRSYKISYSYYHKDKKQKMLTTAWQSNYRMELAEEFPENLNEES